MEPLEAELSRARDLAVSDLADAIQSIGFECTRCGACCTADAVPDDDRANPATGDDDRADPVSGDDDRADPVSGDERPRPDRDRHTATVFPDEVRRLQARTGADWRDVARPMPFGLRTGPDGPTGETFEWALQTDDCGDCRFYAEDADGVGRCTVHPDRPLICRTYPFSVALGGTSQPMGEAVDRAGLVRAHECPGLGRDISRADAEALARALKRRTVRELREAIAVRDNYAPVDPGSGVVVHDSEGAKRPDGSVYRDGTDEQGPPGDADGSDR
jgi:hypothetical protein